MSTDLAQRREANFNPRSGQQILDDLDRATRSLHAASEELSRLTQEFTGATLDEEGQLENGIGLQYDIALQDEISTIYELAENAGQRPPPADVREARALRAVRIEHPELWASYHQTKARITALRSWISNLKEEIGGLQSLRKGEVG